MGLVLIFPMILYPIAISFTVLTAFMTFYLRKNLKNAGNLSKRTISDLRFIAYISLIITFPSVPVYALSTAFLEGALRYGYAYRLADLVSYIQIALYVVDGIIKLICYFYAIKTILFAQGLIKIAVPENSVSEKAVQPITEAMAEITAKQTEVSESMPLTYSYNLCPSCNAQLLNGAEFCTQCGHRLHE